MLATALSIILCASTPAQAAGTRLPETVGLEPAGSYPFSCGTALQVDSAQGLAYVGAGSGVFIVGISDQRSPEVLSDDIRCVAPASTSCDRRRGLKSRWSTGL